MDYQDGDLAAQSDAGYEMNMDKIIQELVQVKEDKSETKEEVKKKHNQE